MSDFKFCVFDIETIPLQSLPEDLRPQPDMSRVKYGNTKNAFDRMKIEQAYVADFEAKIDKTMSLDPYLCQVCALVMHDSSGKTLELFAANEEEEADLLRVFWEQSKTRYMQDVTLVGFNSQSFDFPVLITRSMLSDIPVDPNVLFGMTERQNGKNHWHVDLMQRLGTRNPFSGQLQTHNLDWYCRRFGIESSKQDGMDGSKVWPMFQEGRYAEIIEYCKRDVLATAELCERVAPWIYRTPLRNYGHTTANTKKEN